MKSTMFYTGFPFQSFLILAILASFWVKNESRQLKAMKGKVFSIFIYELCWKRNGTLKGDTRYGVFYHSLALFAHLAEHSFTQ